MSLSVAPVRLAPAPVKPAKAPAKPVVVKAVKPAEPDITGVSGLGHLFKPVGDLWHRITNSAVFKTIAELSFFG